MRSLSLAIVFSCVILGAAFAQPTNDAPADDARTAAALELLEVTNAIGLARQASMDSIDAQIEANPAMAPLRDVMRRWAKGLDWESLAEDFAAPYAEVFTEAELKELIAWNRSPLGQKVLRETPGIMKKGMQLGARLARESEPELKRMIQEFFERQDDEAPEPENSAPSPVGF